MPVIFVSCSVFTWQRLLYYMTRNLITRLHWHWLNRTDLYKVTIRFSTFYLQTSWLTEILAFLSLVMDKLSKLICSSPLLLFFILQDKFQFTFWNIIRRDKGNYLYRWIYLLREKQLYNKWIRVTVKIGFVHLVTITWILK